MQADFAIRHIQALHGPADAALLRQRLAYATFVNLERRYMFVEVPKAGCTSLKTMLRALEGLPPIDPSRGSYAEVTRAMAVHDRALFGMPSLVDFDDATQQRILTAPDFLRFAVVRNPYTRLESAWREKIRLVAPGYGEIYRRLRGRIPDRFTERDLISFAEFVRLVAQQDVRRSDTHWRLQSALLYGNALNLNLIGRLENLRPTLERFLQWAGYPADTRPPGLNRSGEASQYDAALAAQVAEIYADDFATFGYAKDSWTPASPSPPVPEARYAAELCERHVVIADLHRRRAARPTAPSPAPASGNLPERLALEPLVQANFDRLFDQVVKPIEGWLTKLEARALYDLAREVTGGCIVEVGSYRGRSTAALALGSLAGAGVPVYAVEPHEEFTGSFGAQFGAMDRGHFMRTMAQNGLFHVVRLINLGSEFLADRWPHPVSLLWIDGDHRYPAVTRDFDTWRTKLTPGALVAFDDGADARSGPGRLISRLVGEGMSVAAQRGKIVILRAAAGTKAPQATAACGT